jgi:NAD kinase
VLPSDSELSLAITDAEGITTLVVDGQGFYPMKEGDVVKLRRHPVHYPLLARPGEDFFKRLRDRLGWRGRFEPDEFPKETPGRAREVDAGESGVL